MLSGRESGWAGGDVLSGAESGWEEAGVLSGRESDQAGKDALSGKRSDRNMPLLSRMPDRNAVTGSGKASGWET